MLGYGKRCKSPFQRVGILSRIIRTVSLTKETDELAAQKPNFSSWVRNQLILDRQNVSLTHTAPDVFEKYGVCSPSMTPRCGICFPYGKPTQELIRKYNSEKDRASYRILSDNRGREKYPEYKIRENMKEVVHNLQEATKNHYGGIIPDNTPKNNEVEPFTPPVRERKYLRRALRYIWSFI